MPQSMQRAAWMRVSFVRQRQDEFAPMPHALLDRLVVAVVAFEFEKAGDLAHAPVPAAHRLADLGSRPGIDAWPGSPAMPAIRPTARIGAYRACLRPCPSRRARGDTRPASPCGTSGSRSSSRRGFARRAAEPVKRAWRAIRRCSRSAS